MTDSNNIESNQTYSEILEPIREVAEEIKEEKLIGKLPDEVVEHITPKTTQSKKKSAKELFAEATGFSPVVNEKPIRGMQSNKIVVDEVQEVTNMDLGLTEPEPEEEAASRVTYKASAVEKVPVPAREGMQVFGLGQRRQVRQNKVRVKEPRVNRNTNRVYPDKGLGSINNTTFKG